MQSHDLVSCLPLRTASLSWLWTSQSTFHQGWVRLLSDLRAAPLLRSKYTSLSMYILSLRIQQFYWKGRPLPSGESSWSLDQQQESSIPSLSQFAKFQWDSDSHLGLDLHQNRKRSLIGADCFPDTVLECSNKADHSIYCESWSRSHNFWDSRL